MKPKTRLIVGACAALALCEAVQAQYSTPSSASPSGSSSSYSSTSTKYGPNVKASDVIGATVRNYQDQKLGEVEDLAVDLQSGRVVQVILSTGGFLGIGETMSAAPPAALHYDANRKIIQIDADKEKLTRAPKFEMSKWAQCCDPNYISSVYSTYGQDSTLTFIQRGTVQNPSVLPAPRDTTTARDVANEIARDINNATTREVVGQWTIPTSRLTDLQRGSKIRGMTVKNLQNEKLGKIEDFLVDLQGGRVVVMVVSSGGFIGIGDELSAVPPTAFRPTTEKDTLQLDATKAMLSSAPHFKSSQWPDFEQPGYVVGVYRTYRVDPYFSTSGQSVTPIDQGNSQADVDTTAQIRREIIARNLSVNADNIKIVTSKGHVTLRGPVNSSEEERQITEIAKRVAGSDNVESQLELNLTPTGNNPNPGNPSMP